MKIESEEIKNIKNIADFCRFFAISEQQFKHFKKNKNKLFKVAGVPKRNGDFRIVYPIFDSSYRIFLKAVTEMLNDYYLYGIMPPPKSVHGFVKGKSIITNAQCHLQKKILLNLDIKNFFESIKKEKVYNIFIDLGFNKKYSLVLTEFVTVNEVLATGFPTSPVLANIICKQMDYVLEKLCKKYEAVYTRYADDISISSNTSVPEKTILARTLDLYGFKINEDKYKIQRRGGSQYVTGLTVCDKRPRLSKRLKKNIRLELYYIKKYGFINHFVHKPQKFENLNLTLRMIHGYGVHGYIAFIHSIEPELAQKMWKQLNKNGQGTAGQLEE
jgi:retron-type reverse transcriptase